LKEAEEVLKDLVEFLRAQYGWERDETLKRRSDLARVHHLQHKDELVTEAEFRDLLASEDRVLGERSAEALRTRDRFLKFSIDVKKPELASAISSKWPDPPNPDVASQLEGLALSLIHGNQYAQAESLLRQ